MHFLNQPNNQPNNMNNTNDQDKATDSLRSQGSCGQPPPSAAAAATSPQHNYVDELEDRCFEDDGGKDVYERTYKRKRPRPTPTVL